jgi:hypothetical protein
VKFGRFRGLTQRRETQDGENSTAILHRKPLASVENVMLRRILKIGGEYLPYLAWLVPLLDRMLPSKKNAVAPGLMTLSADLRNDIRNDLREHIVALQATQVDVTPAIEEQQRRLEKLEENTAELNHSLTNLSEDQLDLADQVRAMASWVRNSAIAGLFLLSLMFILKLIQAIHGMSH